MSKSLFDRWEAELFSGKPPARFQVAAAEHPLSAVEVAPHQVLVIGAPPGTGKTALTMQLALNAMAFNPALRVLVANVEMTPEQLLDRQLARLSGVGLNVIRSRSFDTDQAIRLRMGISLLREFEPQLMFVPKPFDIPKIAEHADRHQADIVILDYVQRIRVASKDTAKGDSRKSVVDDVMDAARSIADCGAAVIAVSAVGRQKSSTGKSSYDNLNMASFRESSELEYGADDAYILERSKNAVTMKHLKARNSETCDIPLRFVGATQTFEPSGRFSSAVEGCFADLDAALSGEGEDVTAEVQPEVPPAPRKRRGRKS